MSDHQEEGEDEHSDDEGDIDFDEHLMAQLYQDFLKTMDSNNGEELAFNNNTVYLSSLSPDHKDLRDCDYCKPKNSTLPKEAQSDEVYHMGGFTAPKIRTDSFEVALDLGACRSADFIYFRNQRTSCCEVWNYRVPIDKFKPSGQQKKAMRRFQRFLREGPTASQKEKEKEWEVKMKKQMFDNFATKLLLEAATDFLTPAVDDSQKKEILKRLQEEIIRDLTTTVDVEKGTITLLVTIACQESPEDEREKRTALIVEALNDAAILKYSEGASPDEYCVVLNQKAEGLFGEVVIAPVFSSWAHEYIQSHVYVDKPKDMYPNSKLEQFQAYDPVKEVYLDQHPDYAEAIGNKPTIVNPVLKERRARKLRSKKKANHKKDCENVEMASNDYSPEEAELSNSLLDSMKRYSIEVHQGHFNMESFQLQRDYELNVHKRSVESMTQMFVFEFMSGSPIFDPSNQEAANKPAPWESSTKSRFELVKQENQPLIDSLAISKQPFPPRQGSYQMHHRIDGELVAIGQFELTGKYFNSSYFSYKTKYAYLNLGVIGAMIELEFCRKLRSLGRTDLQYYHLGELVVDCPKVNYKLNYKPGEVLCPYSKEWVPFSDAEPEIMKLKYMTKKEKLTYQLELEHETEWFHNKVEKLEGSTDEQVAEITKQVRLVQFIKPLRLHPTAQLQHYFDEKHEGMSFQEALDKVMSKQVIKRGRTDTTAGSIGSLAQQTEVRELIRQGLIYMLMAFGPKFFHERIMLEYKPMD